MTTYLQKVNIFPDTHTHTHARARTLFIFVSLEYITNIDSWPKCESY